MPGSIKVKSLVINYKFTYLYTVKTKTKPNGKETYIKKID